MISKGVVLIVIAVLVSTANQGLAMIGLTFVASVTFLWGVACVAIGLFGRRDKGGD